MGVTVAVHTSACTLPILAFGTDEQRSRFVPPLARGEGIGAFALTEPEAGSDAGSLRTKADPNDDGWTITGAKQWITNGEHASTFLLFARTDSDTPGAKGVSAFVLDADHVRITREEEKLGLNSSVTNDIVVEGAEVGRDRLLHEESKGFTVAMATLDTVDPEPLPEGHWLYAHPRVRVAAHVSWYSPELQRAAVDIFVDNLGRFLRDEPLRGVVDPAEGY